MDHSDVQRNVARIKAPEDRVASAAALSASAALGLDVSTPSAVTPAAAAPCVTALDSLNLNVIEGVAGTFTQYLLQHFVCKEAVHQAYIQQKEDGPRQGSA